MKNPKKINAIVLIVFAAAVLIIIGIFHLREAYGVTLNAHAKAVRKEQEKLMAEQGIDAKEAKAIAEEKVAQEEEIMERIRAGEKIDGYAGYHACKPEILGSDITSAKIQIADMVFDQSYCMSVDDVTEVVKASQYAKEWEISEVFYAYYRAIEVKDKDGHEVLTFTWRPLREEDCPWVNETQNYLCMVKPTAYGPWTKESVYYPGGYQYYYKDLCTAEEEGAKDPGYKKITRDSLLGDLYNRRYSESMTCSLDEDCYCFILGESSTTAGFVDERTRGLKRTDELGRAEFFQTIHEYEFTFDTDGNCTDIIANGSTGEWVLKY